MPANPDVLKDVPLFRELDANERAVLATQAEEMRWPAQARIFSQGDAGDSFFVVTHGQVELSMETTTGERRVLGSAGPGEFFGELSLLDSGPRSADAIAVEDSQAVEIDRSDLTELFRLHPSAALDVLSVTGKRLRETNRALLASVGTSPNQEVEERSTTVQRAADGLAAFSGSIPFLVLHAAVFTVWVAWNLGVLVWLRPFDPFPFGLLTLVTSLEAIFLSCFVLISQRGRPPRTASAATSSTRPTSRLAWKSPSCTPNSTASTSKPWPSWRPWTRNSTPGPKVHRCYGAGRETSMASATSSATSRTFICSRPVSFTASRSMVAQKGQATASVPLAGPW
jgi:CRP/FNR family transcriptional regulator, cyclic AMP receptor protein